MKPIIEIFLSVEKDPINIINMMMMMMMMILITPPQKKQIKKIKIKLKKNKK